jgi:HPt (histidine-containing phosphotransfer) domain-containing protein
MAHTIKGAAANVFAARVADLAQTVERAAKQGSTASIPEDVRQLTSAVALLVQALDAWAARLTTRREVA